MSGALRVQVQALSRGDDESPGRIGILYQMHPSTLAFRVTTLNLEQDHKRWDLRRELVIDPLAALRPGVMAFNEVCIPGRPGADSSISSLNG